MRKTLYMILLLAASVACSKAPELCGNGEMLLEDGWEIPSGPFGRSVPAKVPCTVAGALADAGYFGSDIFVNDNYSRVDKSIFDEEWTYSTSFRVDRKAESYILDFDGISYYADIFLNGRQLASSDTTKGVFIKRSFDITSIVKKNNTQNLMVEMEVENFDQLRALLNKGVDVIMLDNMSNETMAEALKIIKESGDKCLVEGSGNMTLERAKQIADLGLDFISVGALTHSVKALDISMRI